MSENNTNVPKIRFPGFTDAWEQRKLGDVTKSYSGGTPSVGKSEYYDGEIPFIRSAEINSDSTELFITESGLNNSSAKMVEVGDILYALYGATSGEVGISRINGAINQAILAIQSEAGYDSQFIMQWLRSQKQKIIDKYLQGGQGNLSGSIVKDLQIEFPNYEEQKAIGQFFQNLDHLITLHQRRLGHLQDRKKSLLQKMFPKNGADVPEIRFPGFTHAWEQRRFYDLIKNLTGGASIKPDDYQEMGVRTIPKGAVNSSGVADLSGSKHITNVFFEKNISSKVSTGDLVTSLRDLVPSAPNMGRIVKIKGKKESFLMPQGVYRIELQNDVDADFIIAFSNSDKYRKVISAEKNGSTQVHIRNGEFLNIEIQTPNFDEQKKIGNFFNQLDQLITLHQRKLNHLQEQKKSLLQQMFV